MTELFAHDAGKRGRPISAATRRKGLRLHYLAQVGRVENLDAVTLEKITAAVELTALAAEQRARVTKRGNAATSDDLLAIVRLENAASRAVGRLEIPNKIDTGSIEEV
jgi:hypothetical protein